MQAFDAAAATKSIIAQSGVEIVTAELLLRRIGEAFERIAASRSLATIAERAELKWHAAYVVELCRRATERIFAASGAHSVYDDNRLQAVFRDTNTACHHAVVDFDSTAEMFGRVTLGLPPETPLV